MRKSDSWTLGAWFDNATLRDQAASFSELVAFFLNTLPTKNRP